MHTPSLSILAHVALLGWIPFALLLASWLRGPRGIVMIFVVGQLFLPETGYRLPVLSYDKSSAISLSALAAMLMFDGGRIAALRPRLLDLPVAIWCLVPIATSISNGLGVYDGLITALSQTVTWGVPYLAGRAYCANREGMRDAAIGIVIGGLLYAPLCLWESKMSPQLNRQIYGFQTRKFHMAVRMGGYRPNVFMQLGIAVGLFMGVAALTAFWLWRRDAFRRISWMPASWVACGLLVVAALCRAMNAYVLVIGSLLILYLGPRFGGRLALVLLALCGPAYTLARSTESWSGRNLVEYAARLDEVRAMSLSFRLDAEDLLIRHANIRPVLGWGEWGRNRPTIEETGKPPVTDGLWIIAYGKHGAVGLASLHLMMVLPLILLAVRTTRKRLFSTELAPDLAMALAVGMFMVDCLFNAMLNPIYILAAGALSGRIRTLRAASDLSAVRVPPRPPVARRAAHPLPADTGVA